MFLAPQSKPFVDHGIEVLSPPVDSLSIEALHLIPRYKAGIGVCWLEHPPGKFDLQKITKLLQTASGVANEVLILGEIIVVGIKLLILVMQLNDAKPGGNDIEARI